VEFKLYQPSSLLLWIVRSVFNNPVKIENKIAETNLTICHVAKRHAVRYSKENLKITRDSFPSLPSLPLLSLVSFFLYLRHDDSMVF